ncbi:MAG: ATP-dependent Clp protease adaptor ClpS [Kofleriaceae bacterium]
MEAFVLLISSFAASGALWTWQNRARIREERQRQKQLASMLDEGMQVALHLAKHTASTRNQPLTPLAVLCAVLQDDRVAAAIDKLGGDRTALEAAIEAKLDAPEHGLDPREGNQLLGSALGIAHGHGRQMTCTDAVMMLLRTPAGQLLEQPPLTGDALVFELVHGDVPPLTLPRETHVHVVLRNDDFTPMQLVEQVLQRAFELDAARAHELMRAVHEGGRAVVGRFGVEDARERIEKGRALARASHAPLWLGVEAC